VTIRKLQATISILVLSTFLLVTAVIALTPVVCGYPPDSYTDHLRAFTSIYSGIVGLIIGFYFGRSRE